MLEEYRQQYHKILSDYLASGNEGSLYRITELSKNLLRKGIGPEEVIEIHASALKSILVSGKIQAEEENWLTKSFDLLLESMITYGISYHEFIEEKNRESDRTRVYIETIEKKNKELREAQAKYKEENLKLNQKTSELDTHREMLEAALKQLDLLIYRVERHMDINIRFENPDLVSCSTMMQCEKTDCPCYNMENSRCWQVVGTHCGHEIEGLFARKLESCEKCPVFLAATHKPVNHIGEHFNNMMHMMRLKQGELEKAMVDAQGANKAKGEFLANMSHEIRTPLNGIIGMTNRMLTTDLTSKQREYLEIIQESGDDLLAVINDVLDYSKIEAGRIDVEVIDFNLQAVVEQVIETMRQYADQKNLELDYTIGPGVPALVLGDPSRLRQILANLVNNAIKFTDRGSVKVELSVNNDVPPPRRNGDKTTILFSIIDTGIGIAEEHLDIIFDKFIQADGSTTRKYGGTGLGLAISRQFVQIMGGEIGVESKLGQGSRFWFTLPFELKVVEDAHEVKRPAGLTGRRILVASDDDQLVSMLKSFGCRPSVITTKEKILETLKSCVAGAPCSLVMLDFRMPDIAGWDIASTGKNGSGSDEKGAARFAVLASSDISPETGEIINRNNLCYLADPIRHMTLQDTLIKALHSRQLDAKIQTRPAPISERSKTDLPQKHRALLAEDNVINQMVARTLLEDAGYEVDVVDNGLKAIEAFGSTAYSLVLMDIQMPFMDGFEATKKIREMEAAHHTPIIAMTAYAMKEDRDKCLRAGMDDYISKPFKEGDFFAILAKWNGAGPNNNSPA